MELHRISPITVFPQGLQGETLSGLAGRDFKTASAEFVEAFGEKRITAAGEDGSLRTLRGSVALVHKPLFSAAAVCRKGNFVITAGAYGTVMPPTAVRNVHTLLHELWDSQKVTNSKSTATAFEQKSLVKKKSMHLAPAHEHSASSSVRGHRQAQAGGVDVRRPTENRCLNCEAQQPPL